MATIADLDAILRRNADMWRQQLLVTNDIARSLSVVSDSMAEVIATQQTLISNALSATPFAAWQAASITFDIGREFAEVIDSALKGPARAIGETLVAYQSSMRDLLRPVAQIAALNLAERFRDWDEDHRRMDRQLRRFGWWVPPSWTSQDAAAALAMGQRHGKRALDKTICAQYRSDNGAWLRDTVGSWGTDPAVRLRRAIVRDAVQDHLAGRYRVSIPTLLPTIEGIAVDVFLPATTQTSPRRVVATGVASHSSWDDALIDGLIEVLTVLYGTTDFSSARPRSRQLNRHLILHGRTVAYGTEANSLKLLLTLDHLVSEIATKRRYDQSGVPASG
jgi:hypothetical protein